MAGAKFWGAPSSGGVVNPRTNNDNNLANGALKIPKLDGTFTGEGTSSL
jgi:hypothetical protein